MKVRGSLFSLTNNFFFISPTIQHLVQNVGKIIQDFSDIKKYIFKELFFNFEYSNKQIAKKRTIFPKF
jgi:hypothetical protein